MQDAYSTSASTSPQEHRQSDKQWTGTHGLPLITTIDDIHAEVWHLFHLIDATRDALMEMDYVRDGKRMADLDRVAGLTNVARHFAEAIGTGIDKNYHAIRDAAAARTAAQGAAR